MTPDDALKWGASFVMSSGGLLGIYHFVKNSLDLRKTFLENRKTLLEIELKKLELYQASASVKLASLEEMDQLIKTRSTNNYSAKSRAIIVCLCTAVCFGGALVWASANAHLIPKEQLQPSKNKDLNQALLKLKNAEDRLKQLNPPADGVGKEPPPKANAHASSQRPKSKLTATLSLRTIGDGQGAATVRVFNTLTFPVTISVDPEEKFAVPEIQLTVPAKTTRDMPVSAGPSRYMYLSGGGKRYELSRPFPAIGGNVLELKFGNDHPN